MANNVLLSHDLAKYRELFGESTEPDDEKDQKILIIASIIQAFIDAAHGISPTQLSMRAHAVESSRSSEACDTLNPIRTIYHGAGSDAAGFSELGT